MSMLFLKFNLSHWFTKPCSFPLLMKLEAIGTQIILHKRWICQAMIKDSIWIVIIFYISNHLMRSPKKQKTWKLHKMRQEKLCHLTFNFSIGEKKISSYWRQILSACLSILFKIPFKHFGSCPSIYCFTEKLILRHQAEQGT